LVVSVPVLSLHTTSTAAIVSTALSRCTTAPRALIRTAPRVNEIVAVSTSPCGTIEVMVAATIFTNSAVERSRTWKRTT